MQNLMKKNFNYVINSFYELNQREKEREEAARCEIKKQSNKLKSIKVSSSRCNRIIIWCGVLFSSFVPVLSLWLR